MKKLILTGSLAASTLLGLGASTASAATILYGLGVAPITLDPTTIIFDRTSGEAAPVGSLGDPAARPFGLAVTGNTFYTFDGASDRIRRIDPFTGAFTGMPIDIGIGNLSGEGDIAFNLTGSVGYITTANRPGGSPTEISPSLYSFNLATGTSALIGTTMDSVGPITVDGMAFNSVNGLLYAITDADTQLYTLNATSGLLTPVGELGVTPNSGFGALTFDSETSTLFGVINDALYTINTATGAATPVDPAGFGTDFGSISGLASSNIPEPGSTAMLLLGALGLASRRRRS